MKALIAWAASNPLLVGLLTVMGIVAGGVAFTHMPIDAVPDVTNIQVQVVTRVPALSATEVETQITQPLERTMAGLPGLKEMRSITKLGISILTLVFRDDVDVYFARALVNERLSSIRAVIPEDIGRPELGPIATGLGEIYMFELKTEREDARAEEELRTIVEWQIGPRLRQVRGVIDVVGFGGSVKQYQVTLDPARLAAHGVSIEDVRKALERDNALAGGGYIEHAGEQIVLRGDARFRGLEDIASSVIRSDEHNVAIRVGMVGTVDTGPALRQGAMTRDGRGEVVGASVWMLKGENSREVVQRVKEALEEIKPRLPHGVYIDPYYDRAEFIDRVLKTVMSNLAEGATLVVVCLLLTLGSIRAGLLVAGAIPFAMLMAFIGLTAMGLGGNVMSLGSVDFGIVVEGAVVVVEHVMTHLGSPADRVRRRHAMLHSMQEVARPVVFSVIIVTLVFLPLVTLEDVEGKMFRPVVYSLVFMLLGALFYALVIVPAVAPALFKSVPEPKEPWLARQLAKVYSPAVEFAVHRPLITIGATFALAVVMLGFGSTLGAEFLPKIFEGSFAIDARRPPSVSLSQAIDLGEETERALTDIPEVKTIVNRIGRPEGAVDPAGPESSDVFVILKPQKEWRHGVKPDDLVEEMSKRLNARVPATIHAFSQPIEMRVNDLIAGVKSDLAIKVFGYDLDEMRKLADEIRRTVAQVPGAADVKMEIPTGLPSIKVKLARDRAARLGVPPRSVLDAVTMTRAGENIAEVREGERVFDLNLRIGGDKIQNEYDLARLPVYTERGSLVPMSLVADIEQESTVVQISREQMKRRLVVESNIRGRDLVGFVNEAQAKVAQLKIPHGIELTWGGQFQNFNRAKTRLSLLVPVALGVIALMLVMAFKSVKYMLVTVLNLPFAIAGGAISLVGRGLPFSIPAGVGFIALSGVSVMTGVVMTTNLIAQSHDLPPEERVKNAAMASLRPIASTALVAAIGFVPMAIATGPGAEVQRPLATVVIGGLIAAAVLSLPALPAMLLWVVRREKAGPAADPDHEHAALD
ncbi:efflux RND transporter permease subunit [Pendulispora albinea]|uniref:CusA/CzcA family heavy metal efflux RND transporter n=1 Tax=Pendulispora albinea TaxID=2741071 RepID=A0ABZ2LPX2_9BACT